MNFLIKYKRKKSIKYQDKDKKYCKTINFSASFPNQLPYLFEFGDMAEHVITHDFIHLAEEIDHMGHQLRLVLVH